MQIHLDTSSECTLTVSESQGMFRHMETIKTPANTCYKALQFEYNYQIPTCLVSVEDKPYFIIVFESTEKVWIGVRQDDVLRCIQARES